jgi:hypothetical protein
MILIPLSEFFMMDASGLDDFLLEEGYLNHL